MCGLSAEHLGQLIDEHAVALELYAAQWTDLDEGTDHCRGWEDPTTLHGLEVRLESVACCQRVGQRTTLDARPDRGRREIE